MDISEFTDRLRSALADRGVSPDKADAYINNLYKHLTPEDVANVTEEEIVRSADVCAKHLMRNNSPAEMPSEIISSDASERSYGSSSKEKDIQNDPADISDTSNTVSSTPPSDITEKKDTGFSPIPDSGMYRETKKTSPRGIAMLVLISVISSPLWVIAAAIFFAPFIIMFAVEIALTAALICLLAGGAAAGTAASLTGIVYGIVKMFSVPSVGLYEIGFGIIIAGVTMICGILIYNGAVRFMPWLIKKTGYLFKFAFSKVKPLISEYKRRCEKL